MVFFTVDNSVVGQSVVQKCTNSGGALIFSAWPYASNPKGTCDTCDVMVASGVDKLASTGWRQQGCMAPMPSCTGASYATHFHGFLTLSASQFVGNVQGWYTFTTATQDTHVGYAAHWQ